MAGLFGFEMTNRCRSWYGMVMNRKAIAWPSCWCLDLRSRMRASFGCPSVLVFGIEIAIMSHKFRFVHDVPSPSFNDLRGSLQPPINLVQRPKQQSDKSRISLAICHFGTRIYFHSFSCPRTSPPNHKFTISSLATKSFIFFINVVPSEPSAVLGTATTK